MDHAAKATVILERGPMPRWIHQCHAASVELLHSGEFDPCRVARGSCTGVGGQHSWLILGDNCYDKDATIIDGTLWSYDKSVKGVWVGTYRDGKHKPHGSGSIWKWGRPFEARDGQALELTPSKPWSPEARQFLDLLGPLDLEGWVKLAHAPVENWPAREIIEAIMETPHPTMPGSTLAGYVPIDIIGMLTDRNPGEVYIK